MSSPFRAIFVSRLPSQYSQTKEEGLWSGRNPKGILKYSIVFPGTDPGLQPSYETTVHKLVRERRRTTDLSQNTISQCVLRKQIEKESNDFYHSTKIGNDKNEEEWVKGVRNRLLQWRWKYLFCLWIRIWEVEGSGRERGQWTQGQETVGEQTSTGTSPQVIRGPTPSKNARQGIGSTQ